MKLLAWIFVLATKALCSKLIVNQKDILELSSAFKNISSALFGTHKGISVINFAQDFRIVDALIATNFESEVLPSKIIGYKSDVKLNESAILIFDSTNSLIDFNKNVKLTNKFPNPFVFLIFCIDSTFEDLSSLSEVDAVKRRDPIDFVNYQSDMTDILQFQYFVVKEETSIRLLTFVWYTEKMCSSAQLIQVNRFDTEIQKWKNSNFSLKKFENFYGCELVFGAFQ